MSTSTHQMRRNDTAPAITATLTSGGTAVDLTGATVRFHMMDESKAVIVDAAATVVSAAAGTVKYDWAAGDTDTSGRFKAEWEVTFADATIRTFPVQGHTNVLIHDDIA